MMTPQRSTAQTNGRYHPTKAIIIHKNQSNKKNILHKIHVTKNHKNNNAMTITKHIKTKATPFVHRQPHTAQRVKMKKCKDFSLQLHQISILKCIGSDPKDTFAHSLGPNTETYLAINYADALNFVQNEACKQKL